MFKILHRLPLSESSIEHEPTLGECLDRWIDFKSRSSWAPRTRELVGLFSRNWRERLGGKPLRTIRPIDIQDLYLSLDDGSVAAATINKDRSWLRCFWKWAMESEIAWENPTHAWPRKRGPRKRRYLQIPPEDEKRLLAFLKPRFARWVLFVLAAGLRIGETRKMAWGWISPDNVLQIPSDSRKQRRGHRMALPARVVEALGPRGSDDEPVFPGIPNRSALGRVLKRAGRKAGLAYHGDLSPHQFRRTWYGRMRRVGIPAEACKDIGGWESKEVMENFYWTPIPDDEMRAFLERI